MHFSNVLFPEPDGPQITMTSPSLIEVEHCESTCVVPYHLSTFSIVMTGTLTLPVSIATIEHPNQLLRTKSGRRRRQTGTIRPVCRRGRRRCSSLSGSPSG